VIRDTDDFHIALRELGDVLGRVDRAETNME
jgi:hypothetical protein